MSGERELEGTPWYRYFWPWFIVILMGVSMASALATVWLAHHNADSEVRDDWYKEGVAINRRLEQQQRARAQGLHARLELAGASGLLVVHLDGPGSEQVPALRLHMSHATLAARDMSMLLDRVGPQRFEVAPSGELEGRWYATLEPVLADDAAVGSAGDWRLESAFRMPSSTEILFGHGLAEAHGDGG
jgi:hypothetical protein